MDRERRVPAGRIQTDTDAAEYGGAGRWGVGLVDVLVVLGLGLVAAGCWALWGWPAAALVVGVVVLAGGLVGAWKEGREGKGE